MINNKLYKKYCRLFRKKKFNLALKKISFLASKGHLKSQKFLSKTYYDGNYVTQNYNKAVKWTRYACLQGDPASQFLLSNMYEEGNGLEQDTLLSIKWKKNAALQSYEKAIVSLGITYLWGNEFILENKKEALKWFSKGAKIKSSECYYYMAIMYYNGYELKKNYIKSYQYILLALLEDEIDIFSLILRKNLFSKLDNSELHQAKRLYKNYLKKYYK